MHKDEIEINKELVKNLIAEQFPQFNNLSLWEVNSTGTVNTIYRLGDKYYVRLPRLDWANESLLNEWRILPVISNHLTLAVPEIVKKGEPSIDYPLHWAIYKWIDGDTIDNSSINEVETAKSLAEFIMELRSIHILEDAPKAGRKPLYELDEMTVNAIRECDSDIDNEKALKVWRKLLNTKSWDGNPVWIHADLLKPNLIVREGRLFAIIDFGSAGIGDPAFDIIPAWTIFTSKSRYLFRSLLNVDDYTWLRAKAYALHQAALIIPYYRKSNPAFVNQAKNTITNILLSTEVL